MKNPTGKPQKDWKAVWILFVELYIEIKQDFHRFEAEWM